MANLADHLFRQARERGGKCALIYEGQRYSFADIADVVQQLAAKLAQAGIATGDRVGLMMNARPEFIAYQQALFALGATASPLNIFYRPGEIAHAVASCGLSYLVVATEFLDRLPPPETTGTLRAIFTPALDADNRDPRVIAVDELAAAPPLAGPVDLPESAISLMLNTSATTGKSKGVMLSIANIRANYDHTPEWLGLDGDTVTLCALPLYNTFGLNQCVNALMVTGGTMVLMPRFDPLACIEAIERHRCTFFPAVPTMLQKLFDHPASQAHDLSSISRIMTGGAPVPAALIERILATMGRDTTIITGYGLTEATALVSIEAIALDAKGRVPRPKTIGRPVPGIEMKIVGEDGADAQVGGVGEIWIRGPNVMQGYYAMPGESAAAISDGWLRSGDLGMVDAEGYFSIVDRKKDIIIRGGQNVYPADIEEVLYRAEGVSEVAVIGMADDALGEVPVAYVALRPGARVSAEALMARCRDELAYFKVPAAIHFLPELPKGPTGKILRRGLRPQHETATH